MQQLSRVPCPAVFIHQDHLTLLEGIESDGQLRLLDPELGPLRVKPEVIQPPKKPENPRFPARDDLGEEPWLSKSAEKRPHAYPAPPPERCLSWIPDHSSEDLSTDPLVALAGCGRSRRVLNV